MKSIFYTNLRESVSRKYQHLHGSETRPGWRWDGYLWTWMEVRQYIEVVKTESRDLDPVEEGHGWRWDTHLETCMGLRWCLDGTKMQFGGPWWRWDVTWMEVKCKYQDPDWGKIQLRQRRDVYLTAWVESKHKSRDLDGVEMGPGLSWDAHLETWMGDMGLGWSWVTFLKLQRAWVEVRHTSWNMYAFEMMLRWNQDAIWWTSVKVRCYLDVGEMEISWARLK